MAEETLVYWRAGFSPALSLLMPTFSFLTAPEYLAGTPSAQLECSPTTLASSQFRWCTYARLLSTLDRSTSELLRTL